MSAIASAQQNDSPMLVLGGRAPAMRWGQGSLQEIDHVPFVAAADEARGDARDRRRRSPALVDEALRAALTPHSGPTFLDFPLDHVFTEAEEPASGAALPDAARGAGADGDAIERAVALLRDAERPVVMAGTNLYWGHGEDALLRARRGARDPGVPQRPGARLRARRPRAVLLARPRRRR